MRSGDEGRPCVSPAFDTGPTSCSHVLPQRGRLRSHTSPRWPVVPPPTQHTRRESHRHRRLVSRVVAPSPAHHGSRHLVALTESSQPCSYRIVGSKRKYNCSQTPFFVAVRAIGPLCYLVSHCQPIFISENIQKDDHLRDPASIRPIHPSQTCLAPFSDDPAPQFAVPMGCPCDTTRHVPPGALAAGSGLA